MNSLIPLLDSRQKFNEKEARSAEDLLEAVLAFGLPRDLVETFAQQLGTFLVENVDRERITINLHRLLESVRSPQSWLTLFEREPDSLAQLLRLFTSSQYMADSLIADPESFDLLRLTDGQPVDSSVLQDEILAEIDSTADVRGAMRVLRDFRHRETLRIAYGDFVHSHPVDTVIQQVSMLADALIEAAVRVARRELAVHHSVPTHFDGTPVQFAVLALGKLGGLELNYSSDVDLIFIYETIAPDMSGRHRDAFDPHAVDEYFQRLGRTIIKLLSESTPRGIAYRVDMRLRPYGQSGPLVSEFLEAVRYYDGSGRTWERQAFIKARCVAGDIALGNEFINQLQPWIYRRYLMRADITGIVALKRRIEQRAIRVGDDELNVKLGHGGIRDIEYVIQFLQLLHAPDQPNVRCSNTLEAIRALQAAGCLTAEEQFALEDNYRFLRRVEHHLQIMCDRQTHRLPIEREEFNRFACRWAEVQNFDPSDAASEFRQQLKNRTTQNRKILDHLLHDAFSSYDDDTKDFECPESDLILDPEPTEEVIESTLAPYGFQDRLAAYRHLQELAVETITFLSTRRSRHFLAAIAPQLLNAIANTPNPDATLISLANVSASIGGKAVLWELFSANPPLMELYIRLCATSPYLANMLTSNPGMVDELLDSLMLDALPSQEELAEDLSELCRGAVEISPILHSFKNSMHLRVGVRDILGKNSITETHQSLSDIAEVCMEQVIDHEYLRLVQQLGMPVYTSEGIEKSAELVVLAVGKLGGREPNYHSDLDVIFLFSGEGHTKSLVPSRRFEPTTNRHFFNQLCQRVIQAVTGVGTTGRLYDLDVRLRPLGRSGQLAITIDDLRDYFRDGQGQIWERQALCKSRPVWGSPLARSEAMQCVNSIVQDEVSIETIAEQIYSHRMQLQNGADEGNLKRGLGGTMDVEFIVQFLQLANARQRPEIVVPNTLEALQRLREANILDAEKAVKLGESYEFLRSIESSIRLMDLSARHELPKDPAEIERLAFLLNAENVGSASGQELERQCRNVRAECRSIFDSTFGQWLVEETLT